MKASIADLGEASVKSEHMALVNKLVDDLDRRGRKNAKGFYEYPAKPAKKFLWPGLKDLYPQKPASEVDVNVLKQRLLVTISRWKPPARSRRGSSPIRARLMSAPSSALVLRPTQVARCPISTAWVCETFVALCEKLAAQYGETLQADAAAARHGRQGRDLLHRFDPYGAEQKAPDAFHAK